MRRRRGLLAALALAACGASGVPASFVDGRGVLWTLPLVGPLEDNLLLTPVLIDGNGPYLFAIDPDANVSIVDEQVVKECRLAAVKGPARVDESGREQARFYAEVHAFELGSLIVDRVSAMIARARSLDQNGRRIYGVIGRDALATSLVFAVDRERGIASLTVGSAWKPPAGAIAIPFTPLRGQGPAKARPLDRRIVTAKVNGHALAMHVDLGAAHSQLREARWDELGLAPVEGRATMIDEVGAARRVSTVVVADDVAVERVVAPRIAFVPYDDKRFPAGLDGALGLDFFRAHDIAIDWAHQQLHLSPRRPVPVAERIARWEVGALGQCKSPGCVTVRIVDPTVGKPLDPSRPHPGLVLSVTREEIAGGMELEVVLEAKDKPELPRIAVNLSPSADRALSHLKPEWVGAELIVVDASPFARPCPNADGCVDLLAR